MRTDLWTSEEVDHALCLKERGLSCSKIAAELGKTKNSVISKLNRITMSPDELAEHYKYEKFRDSERKKATGDRRFKGMYALKRCEHCNGEFMGAHYARFHGDKCYVVGARLMSRRERRNGFDNRRGDCGRLGWRAECAILDGRD